MLPPMGSPISAGAGCCRLRSGVAYADETWVSAASEWSKPYRPAPEPLIEVDQCVRPVLGSSERSTQAEIAAAERAARLELKRHAARLAVERAEATLGGAAAPDADAKLFREFVAGIGGSAN